MGFSFDSGFGFGGGSDWFLPSTGVTPPAVPATPTNAGPTNASPQSGNGGTDDSLAGTIIKAGTSIFGDILQFKILDKQIAAGQRPSVAQGAGGALIPLNFLQTGTIGGVSILAILIGLVVIGFLFKLVSR